MEYNSNKMHSHNNDFFSNDSYVPQYNHESGNELKFNYNQIGNKNIMNRNEKMSQLAEKRELNQIKNFE